MTQGTVPGTARIPDEDIVAAVEDAGTARTGLDRAVSAASHAVAWLAFVAMAISVYEVVMRYGLNAPTYWAHELTVFLIAALFVLGGPAALARDKHIRVRILYDAVSPRARRWLDVLNGLLQLLFCVGMTHAAWTMFFRASHSPTGEWLLERSGTSWNPAFPAYTKALILLALGLMTVQTVLHLAQDLRGKGR